MIEEKARRMPIVSSRIGVIVVAITLAIIVGTLARGSAGAVSVFLVILSAGIVGVAQQTLP